MTVETSIVFAFPEDTAGQEKFQSVTTQQSTPETVSFFLDMLCGAVLAFEKNSCLAVCHLSHQPPQPAACVKTILLVPKLIKQLAILVLVLG